MRGDGSVATGSAAVVAPIAVTQATLFLGAGGAAHGGYR
jgi:hypothetical protein